MTDQTQPSETPDLLNMLKKLEWVTDTSLVLYCPYCEMSRGTGHTEICQLDAAIQEASKPYDHRRRHVELHNSLDELLADFLTHTKNRPSETTIYELMKWSHEQTINPTE